MPELDYGNASPAADIAAARPRLVAYDPSPQREYVRGLIALVVVALFALLVIGALTIAAFGDAPRWKQVADSLGLLLSPVVALVGAVTGFYYGEKAGKFK